ncbi:MAG: tetratricopeptide repeat protein [Longimicrobiales bacterium]
MKEHALWALGAVAVLSQLACSRPPAEIGPISADPALVEALDWYTGVAGRVDDARARELLEDAAEDQDPISMMWLARVHSTGRMGYPEDKNRARDLAATVIQQITAAADAGVLEAVFLVGTAYDEGLGVDEDPGRAFEWHKKAGEAGHVLGAHNTGNGYAAGRGVEQDLAAAVDWWTRAAERGDAITQLRLGEAYEAGRGVEADPETALHWYGLAAASGNAAAEQAMERLTLRD